ncbi:hypothetical protein FNH22_18915 [Fulvivirga sp. M361]|uniref:hypothetical protein n=1 Tax=Fulvivirga sp. M361 TaxID=2594266 RepID=UPI001179C1B2|nr:hypothetical protein [Fulvivirga sp. M361]TRX54827.1 hypothetical protein FNH22_18915 [Fulvivirga sp. M361]
MNKEVIFILNTHMPYVLNNGPIFQEKENWLFEAITETYIPLFEAFEAWDPTVQGGKKMIFSMTPCLFNQLVEGKERYLAYLDIMEKIGVYEVERTSNPHEYNRFLKNKADIPSDQLDLVHDMAHFYLNRVRKSRAFWEDRDIAAYLNDLFDRKNESIDVWTSCPFHNFIPFFEGRTVDHLIRRGVEEFENVFDRKPDGFWMPECAYFPGTEKYMKKYDIGATALTVPGIGAYSGKDKSGVYRHGDLDIYAHDYRLSMYLWKAPDTTFPADGPYREFFRDIGLDVVPEYFKHIGVEVHTGKARNAWTGYKYFSITGEGVDLGFKSLYNRAAARRKLQEHLVDFDEILEDHRAFSHDGSTFIVAFDTELFGHWWHEGVEWLSGLMQYQFDHEEVLT